VYPEHRTACGDRGDAVGLTVDTLVGVRGVEIGFDGDVRGISEIARRR
jgi:hypothetical protein